MIDDERTKAADEAFALYDFGNETVKPLGGWQYLQGQDVWRRTIILNGKKAIFTVRFQHSDVVESYVTT